MKKVIFPTGQHLSPGTCEFRIEETIETDVFWMGNFIETKIEKTESRLVMEIPEPAPDDVDLIDLFDRTFIVVRDDDESFWGLGGRDAWSKKMKADLLERAAVLAKDLGWEIDSEGNPIPEAIVFSKSKLASENKTLMAHIVFELNLFPSIGQARKNGWDKPIEVGDYVATKKKIRFKVID